MTVWLEIPGAPVGKGRARSSSRIIKGRNGKAKVATRHYTPAKTVSYEQAVAMIARAAMRGREPYTGPLQGTFHFGLPIPKSWSKQKREAAAMGEIWPIVKPDSSNILKAIEDACNGIVYHDDAQIVHHIVTKQYAITPGVSVKIEPVK